MASTSSSTVPYKTTYESYDVFLSFSGEDTRANFTSHLHADLKEKSIKTFIDDKLRKGEEISPALEQTIKQSKISIIVFSENYAKSRWCLDELAYILKCEKSNDQIVLPIFYHVSASDVRNKSGTFGKGFEEVKEEFKNNSELVESWSTALTKAADLCGWTSSNFRLESDLTEKVADWIKELCPITFTAPSGLVGIDRQSEKIISLLRIDEATDRCHSVGVWGMGGIGKTTTAKCIFSTISGKFDKYSFFGDVREKLKKLGEDGLVKEFYSKLGFKTKDIQTVDLVATSIGDTLSKEKVLIVLDDVNELKQLKGLLTNVPYGPRSRIIVTSRDKQVLENGVDVIYKLEGLDNNNALQLLSMKAFKEMHPPKGYRKLSLEAVDYAGGVPLALEVLGSHLYKKTLEGWVDILKELKQFHDCEIQKILRISYDELDPTEKDIFLDIACFFKGDTVDWVKEILNGCGLPSSRGISRLADKCLITIDNYHTIRMHDLIEEMGQDIAQEEGSRLWKSEDIRDMLRNNTGNKEVQGIRAPHSIDRNIELHPAAFSNMHNLRILIFPTIFREGEPVYTLKGGQSENLEYLSNKLSVLHWENYPCKSLPSSLFMDNLVELNLSKSNITQLWDGKKAPKNLKRLDLERCRDLKEIPNLSNATKLEVIVVFGCESLIKIHPSISSLEKLIKLNVSYCEKLEILPEIPGGVKELYLSGSGVKVWSQSTQALQNLDKFDMRNCKNIESLTLNNIWLPTSGTAGLDLSGCWKLHKLPEMRGNLKRIDLSETAIEELPSSIECLSSLVELRMKQCRSLKIIPPSICKLKSLQSLDLYGCSKLGKLPPLNGLTSLQDLNLEWTAIAEIPDDICKLKSLNYLNLSGCSKLGKLPPLNGLTSLQGLNLERTAVAEIPDDIVSLSSLCYLVLNNCKRLQHLPKLPKGIIELEVQNCTSLRTVELPFSTVKANFCNCLNLDENACSIILSQPKNLPRYSNSLYYTCSICIPGSAIPEWFEHQSQGSSFSTQLHPNCFVPVSPLFAFSIIIEFNSRFCKTISLKCKCSLQNVKNCNTISRSYECTMVVNDSVKSDHVFLWFHDSELFIENKSKVDIETTFEFEACIINYDYNDYDDDGGGGDGDGGGGDALNIKKCGLHLLYDDDDDDDDALIPSTSSYMNTKKSSSENEEEEPQSEITKDLPYTMAQLKIEDSKKKYFDSVSSSSSNSLKQAQETEINNKGSGDCKEYEPLHDRTSMRAENEIDAPSSSSYMDTNNRSRENNEEEPQKRTEDLLSRLPQSEKDTDSAPSTSCLGPKNIDDAKILKIKKKKKRCRENNGEETLPHKRMKRRRLPYFFKPLHILLNKRNRWTPSRKAERTRKRNHTILLETLSGFHENIDDAKILKIKKKKKKGCRENNGEETIPYKRMKRRRLLYLFKPLHILLNKRNRWTPSRKAEKTRKRNHT